MSDKKYQSLEFFMAELSDKGKSSELELLELSEKPEWKSLIIDMHTIDEYVRFQQAQVWKALEEGYYDYRFGKLSEAIKGYEEANALNDPRYTSFALISLGAAIAQMNRSYKDVLLAEVQESKVAVEKAKKALSQIEKKMPLIEKTASLQLSKHVAQRIAIRLWETPEHYNKRVGDMTQEVKSEFYTKYSNEGNFNDNTFRKWIKEVAPVHAMKRGRPSKK